jgi:phosphoribosylamine--glycine ligase
MGAFAPSPLIDAAMEARIMQETINPVIQGMREEGQEYRGFLYAGLMLTCAGPKVIEFNVRFGDPEAQVVIPMLGGDLLPLLLAASDGALGDLRIPLRPEKRVGIVLASGGYPGSTSSGQVISGLDHASALDDVLVFHAGTAAAANGVTVTAGGRVLTVVGRGDTFEDAIARAYEGVSRITFEGMQYRSDIGKKALSWLKSPS